MESREGRGAMWAIAAPLILLKVWATGLLLFYSPTHDAVVLVLATGWPWLVVLAAMLAAPTLFWWRLVRVRRHREQLRRAEWLLDSPTGRRRPTPTDVAERRHLANRSGQWPVWDVVARAGPDADS